MLQNQTGEKRATEGSGRKGKNSLKGEVLKDSLRGEEGVLGRALLGF